MADPRQGFIPDTQTQITEILRIADAWSALQQEFATFTTNGIVLTDAVVGAAIPGVTAAQYTQALAAMQGVVDNIHIAATAAKLYRVRR